MSKNLTPEEREKREQDQVFNMVAIAVIVLVVALTYIFTLSDSVLLGSKSINELREENRSDN